MRKDEDERREVNDEEKEKEKEEEATVEPEPRSRALDGAIGMMEDAMKSEQAEQYKRMAKDVAKSAGVAGLKVARSALDSLIERAEKKKSDKEKEGDETGGGRSKGKSRKIDIE